MYLFEYWKKSGKYWKKDGESVLKHSYSIPTISDIIERLGRIKSDEINGFSISLFGDLEGEYIELIKIDDDFDRDKPKIEGFLRFSKIEYFNELKDELEDRNENR